MRRASTVVAAVALLGAAPAYAGALQDGEAFYQRGDYAKAYELLRPLADRGLAAAQFRIGDMFRTAEGGARNFPEAIAWYRKAAEQDHKEAQLMLGILYVQGLGVPQDYVLAYMWLNLSAGAGKDLQDGRVAGMIRDGLAEKMTSAQLAEAQQRTRQWRAKHSVSGQK